MRQVLIGGAAVLSIVVAAGSFIYFNGFPASDANDPRPSETSSTAGSGPNEAETEGPTRSVAEAPATADSPVPEGAARPDEDGLRVEGVDQPPDEGRLAGPTVAPDASVDRLPAADLAEAAPVPSVAPANEVAAAPIGEPGGHVVAGAATEPQRTVPGQIQAGAAPTVELPGQVVAEPVDTASVSIAKSDSEAVPDGARLSELVEEPVSSAAGVVGEALSAAAPDGDLPADTTDVPMASDAATTLADENSAVAVLGTAAIEKAQTVGEPLAAQVDNPSAELSSVAAATGTTPEIVDTPAGGSSSTPMSNTSVQGPKSVGAIVLEDVIASGAGSPAPKSSDPITDIAQGEVSVGATVLEDAIAGDAASVAPESSGPTASDDGLGAQVASLPPADAGLEPPQFDVVRVDRLGNMVIAGRSSPSCDVTVHDDSDVIGVATADRRGEWVLLPIEPLRPGDRQLSLRADCGAAGHAVSERVVIVVVPEAPDVPGDQNADVLALSVPRSGNGHTVVLQAPLAEDAVPTPDALSSAVSLLAIDYGADGRLQLSGQAEPGASLNVYLDNELVGSALTGDDGLWTLQPDVPVVPGLYTLRADQLAETGGVEARVEVPFLRADPVSDLPDDRFVVVQPGNSLWRLARRTYGRGIQYSVIYQANADQIRDPDLIYPGQIFMLPPSQLN